MDCYYHDDMFVCWTLYRPRCCFLRKLFNFNIFHLHGPFMRKNCLYLFLFVKTRNFLASTYYLKFMKLAIEFQMNRTIDRLNMKTINTFMRMKKWYEFRRYSLWIFFSPNLLRLVSMRAWHGLFFCTLFLLFAILQHGKWNANMKS